MSIDLAFNYFSEYNKKADEIYEQLLPMSESDDKAGFAKDTVKVTSTGTNHYDDNLAKFFFSFTGISLFVE